MPLFRHIRRNPGDDSTHAFEVNPDPERYESVPEPKAKSAKSTAPASEPEPEVKE